MQRRVLVVALEQVGTRMAGPGIRSWSFARELATRGHEVTLVAPAGSDAAPEGVRLVHADGHARGAVARAARGFDAVVAQVLDAVSMRALARSPTRTIYDLYVPFATENLPHFASQADAARARLEYRATNRLQQIALATGDAFLCASDRQRDLYVGQLAALDRLAPELWDRDPDGQRLIRVVPFGLDSEPPRSPATPVLKGVVPGIGADDRVLLWGGGIWDWFDPLTPIRALTRLPDDVKLVFLGVHHPNPRIRMSMTERAIELARELGLEGSRVAFNAGWVPYEERQGWLLEADLGVSTHYASLETRFAFRTRILDYLWASLPVVTTEGDVLAELVERERLGRVVRPEDEQALAQAIASLLDDPAELVRIRERIAGVRDALTWERVVQPLAELVEDDAPPSPRAASRLARDYRLLLLRASLRRGGLPGLARDALRYRRGF